MHKTQQEDIIAFAKEFALKQMVANSTFLITGGTGLIGSTLIHCLLELKQNIKIIAPVRNIAKAQTIFGNTNSQLQLIECELSYISKLNLDHLDYIIHCAAPTSSQFFVDHAVETFQTIYEGTQSILNIAKRYQPKSVVYLSSLEVYGNLLDTDIITEDIQGYWDTTAVRSSYPIAKRAAENLCCLYANEYHIPVKIARLTQTTGAGIALDDNRVIAQFVRLATEGKDIVLKTTGESARPYCYTTDCISALLYILLKGENGCAYNVANEKTYISARDLAQKVQEIVNPAIHIRFELEQTNNFAPVSKLNLSTTRLKALGWVPQYDLSTIISRLQTYLSQDQKVSVCMSVYKNDNPEHFLTAIRSMVNQTLPPDEIILVIDGPIPDSIQTAIHLLQKECPLVRTHQLPLNMGHAAARQKGIELAKNELIAFMDSDDICLPNRLEKQARYMISNPEISAVGGQITEFIDSPDNIIGKRIVPTTTEAINKYAKYRCPLNMMTTMIRKSNIMNIGGFIDWYCEEDYFLWIRLILSDNKLCNLSDILVNVRVGNEMYQRRGGWKYFKSEAGIQRYMLNHKMISPIVFIYNVMGRFIVQVLMPNNVRSFIFKTLFRQ